VEGEIQTYVRWLKNKKDKQFLFIIIFAAVAAAHGRDKLMTTTATCVS
jgi:hypothetical protein